MDIPFDFKEEREKVFCDIIDKFYDIVNKENSICCKICADYTSCSKIELYNLSKDIDEWKDKILTALNSLTKIVIDLDNDKGEKEVVEISYVIEFDLTDNYCVESDSIKL
jgi:hypothetical protein